MERSGLSQERRRPRRVGGETGAVAPVVVAPTYNNAPTLCDVIERLLLLRLPVIVVNDGSTDGTSEKLRTLVGVHGSRLHVLTHDVNRGKAEALRTGFASAWERNFSHAVTIDTDDQLRPEEIPNLLALARTHPWALIVGSRNDLADDYPRRSRVGRRLSNLAVWLETGVRVEDTQCGLRVYPLDLVNPTRGGRSRFAFETEIITLAAWAGCEIINVPVSCRYFEGPRRVSHFKPFSDSIHAIWMHGGLLLRAIPHRLSRGR